MSDQELIAALTSTQVLACTLYGEARGGTKRGRHAIASVIGNRVKAKGRFGTGIAGVCLQPMQFSCWTPKGGAANYDTVLKAAAEMRSLRPLNKVLRECVALSVDLHAALLEDIVHGATHYYAPAAMTPKGRVPAWANGLTPVAAIDGHLFFAGVK